VPDDPLAPVAKLDVDHLLAAVRDAGVQLELVGRAADGEVGAAFVRWPDGREGVLTGIGGGPLAGEARRNAELLALARQRGVPVPSHDLIVDLPDGGVAIVQERLPGGPPSVRDRALAEAMVATLDSFSGVLADRPDVPAPELYLLRSGPGFCVHESLEAYGPRSRRLLAWVREVGASTPAAMTGTDLVHLDYHASNVLVDAEGRLTGIIDWDGIGRGDRWFGLATLRVEARYCGLPTEVEAWLDALMEEVLDPAVLRLYWAHLSLRGVDWMIRHYTPADVEDRLDLAETRMAL
jgi:aminoglycoside phosphotransferase (APT) family kinase protein